MAYEVRVKVKSFINEGIHKPDTVLVVDELDDRVELIRDLNEKKAAPGKGKKKDADDFLDGDE